MPIELLLERRSIRRFLSKPVSDDALSKIVSAGQRAPSSCGVQTYSFIQITDRGLRDQIAALIGRQKGMDAPVWLMICIDFARPLRLFELLDLKVQFGEVSKLFNGLVDACLAGASMAIAAEELGLGSVFIGSVWGAMDRLAELLSAPRNVFPILLLCIGYPDVQPPLRPRWPMAAVLHKDRYRMFPDEDILRYYEAANLSLSEMKYFKAGIDSLAEHWRRKFKPEEMNNWEINLRKALQFLGFMPSKDDAQRNTNTIDG